MSYEETERAAEKVVSQWTERHPTRADHAGELARLIAAELTAAYARGKADSGRAETTEERHRREREQVWE